MPLHSDRYFDPNPSVREIARQLYGKVAQLPLVCPHGHVDPRMLAEDTPFPNPTDLIVTPDHYIFRMLYSQGISLDTLGIPRADGSRAEVDSRAVWQIFGDHFYLFRGTPTANWLKQEFEEVFGVDTPLTGPNAMAVYDQIASKLITPEFRPRALFDRFNIEVLCTTDAASDSLEYHKRIRESGWKARVLPTFRPDATVNLLAAGWRAEIGKLAAAASQEIGTFAHYIAALESRRRFFREMGATATDHAVISMYTGELSPSEAEAIFQRALGGHATEDDQARFSGHMLMEFARMSVEDGLVMQVHPGSYRNHNQPLFERFGTDKGADIPTATEYTRNLHPLLNKFGNHPSYRLVLFTLDESTYSRELAPLAGHYPALRLGPPWWFFDSIEGMIRFRRTTTETAGIYNTAGFNDDTRAFASIPARHDLCRRVDANYLAGQVAHHMIEMEEAEEMIVDLAYNLARRTYGLG